MNTSYFSRSPFHDGAYFFTAIGNCILRAYPLASLTTVAEFWKDQYVVLDRCDSSELTEIGTLTTESAFCWIDFGYEGVVGPLFFDFRFEEEVAVGFLDVAVVESDAAVFEDLGQIRGYRGLAGSAFSTGNSDDQPCLLNSLCVESPVRVYFMLL